MEKFITKLIERLEELKEDAINEDCPVVPNSEDCEMEYSCSTCYLTAAIRIVEELAEEYINTSTDISIEQFDLSRQIADDLNAVLEEAKSMGCKEVKYFHNIPLENVEIVVKALEKQIPKAPNKYEDIEGITDFYCRKCSRAVGDDTYKFLYCPKCGQKIDWGVEE